MFFCGMYPLLFFVLTKHIHTMRSCGRTRKRSTAKRRKQSKGGAGGLRHLEGQYRQALDDIARLKQENAGLVRQTAQNTTTIAALEKNLDDCSEALTVLIRELPADARAAWNEALGEGAQEHVEALSVEAYQDA